jgi:hypothetical protein
VPAGAVADGRAGHIPSPESSAARRGKSLTCYASCLAAAAVDLSSTLVASYLGRRSRLGYLG